VTNRIGPRRMAMTHNEEDVTIGQSTRTTRYTTMTVRVGCPETTVVILKPVLTAQCVWVSASKQYAMKAFKATFGE
jgi:hypothetical protein